MGWEWRRCEGRCGCVGVQAGSAHLLLLMTCVLQREIRLSWIKG